MYRMYDNVHNVPRKEEKKYYTFVPVVFFFFLCVSRSTTDFLMYIMCVHNVHNVYGHVIMVSIVCPESKECSRAERIFM